jgi:hypothetical protein
MGATGCAGNLGNQKMLNLKMEKIKKMRVNFGGNKKCYF